MEANGLESLLSNFASDTDVHARTQALGAISCKPLLCYSLVKKPEIDQNLFVLSFASDNLLKRLPFGMCHVALIRNNKPGVTAFKLAQGYAGLKAALATDSVRFRR